MMKSSSRYGILELYTILHKKSITCEKDHLVAVNKAVPFVLGYGFLLWKLIIRRGRIGAMPDTFFRKAEHFTRLSV